MKFINASLKKYLAELASTSPIPGGGGTSALAAALGVALGRMVAGIVEKRAKDQTVRSRLINLAQRMKQAQSFFEKVIDRDPVIYQRVMSTYRQTRKMTNRSLAARKVDASLNHSFELQRKLAEEIAEAARCIREISRYAKGSIANDLGVAGALLRGAWQGAYLTAKINVEYVHDPKRKKHLLALLKKTPRA